MGRLPDGLPRERKSHTRTRSSVVQLSLRRDFVVTQAVAPG